MTNEKVTPEDITRVLNDTLKDYQKEVEDTFGQCGLEIAEECVAKLRSVKFKGGYDKGKYSSSWAVKEEKGFMGYPTYIVYNQKHYRLTHLLEYGHAIKNGTGRSYGEVGAQEHIKPVEDWVQEQLPRLLEQKLGGK